MAIKYLDAKRIRGSSTAALTPTFSDDFSSYADQNAADTAWVSDDTSEARVNISTDKIAVTLLPAAATIYHDLGAGNVSDTAWVLRFTFNVVAKQTNSYAFIGLSDNVSNYGTSQDIIDFLYRYSTGSKRFEAHDVDGSAPNGTGNDDNETLDPTTGTDYHMEIARESDTSYKVRRYTDSTYGTVADTYNGTCASTTQSLRYIKLGATPDTSSSITTSVTFDDIKFYNGITSVTTTDEKTTLFTKSLGTDADMTTANMAYGTTGVHANLGDGITFNGSSSYGNVGTSVSQFNFCHKTDHKWSIAFWYKSTNAPSGFETLFATASNSTGTDNGFVIAVHSSRRFMVDMFDGTASNAPLDDNFTSNDIIPDDNWNFYVFTFDDTLGSNNLKIYKNGNGSADHTASYAASSGSSANASYLMWLGRRVNSSEKFFDGSLQGVSIWDKILTSSDINALHASGNGLVATSMTDTSDLKLHWSMNEASGSIANDAVETLLPDNTLFEETDTYRTWWLQDNAWSGYITRGCIAGGKDDSSPYNIIDYITIQSAGNATDFGDTVSARRGMGCLADATRGCIAGGHDGSNYHNIIEYITVATTGNTTDFGDLTITKHASPGLADSTRGCYCGGSTSTYVDVIDYITIQTTGNAADFGNLSQARNPPAALADSTRGVVAGGDVGGSPGSVDTIDYITIQTTGNATDFGNLTVDRWGVAGLADATRGVICGGAEASTRENIMDYITIQTTGNATDFGNLTTQFGITSACADATRGCIAGGASTSTTNIDNIDYITIATTGNAADFGNLTTARQYPGALAA